MKNYIGHSSQHHGVEEHRLIGGKKDGMRILEVRNGIGLQLTISLDRCADISRLLYKGINMSYFSSCGYVSPSYYDKEGNNFLKSFTAGFLTTCGLNAVGSPCVDNGEVLPLHGSIRNTPVESYNIIENEKEIIINALILDETIFSHKFAMYRSIHVSLKKNEFYIEDEIVNTGDNDYPIEILYHMNIGYPLLSENAKLYIPSIDVKPRTLWAKQNINEYDKIIKPQANFEEQCYYHTFKENGLAAIYNRDIKQGLCIEFDANNLRYFTEWKMMGKRDYVLGLEPGNCHPDGRDKMREEGKLTILKPEEKVKYKVKVSMINNLSKFNNLQKGQ